MRRAADTGAAECQYTADWAPPPSARRLEVIMDDLVAGDVTRLHLENQNGWSGEVVTVNGVVLTPVDNPQLLDGLPSTAYSRTHGRSLWLRMVNTSKTHTVVITWP